VIDQAVADFCRALSRPQRRAVVEISSPPLVQAYLDGLAYRIEDEYKSPLSVLRDRRAHCFDGALFGAAMLRRLGFPPLLVNLFAEDDDEHVVAVYKVDGHWGALAKSNFAGLRFREPVYRSLRELVMSYFEFYYNLNGYKSLRSYSLPLNLRSFDRYHWMTDDASLELIAARLDTLHRVRLLQPEMRVRLTRVDSRSYQAGMTGTEHAGLYRANRGPLKGEGHARR
jgi:hypothetical protein